MTFLQIFSICMFLFLLLMLIIGYLLISKINVLINDKLTDEKLIHSLIDKIHLEDSPFTKYFTKDVIDVYTDILKNPGGWMLDGCRLKNASGSIQIWAENRVINRRFIDYSASCDSEEIKLKNERMTYYDKLLLDKLVTAIRDRQDVNVAKFFI